MSFVGDFVDSITGADRAAETAQAGAATTAAAQREALDYLKQTEKIPQQFREGALTALGGLYGIGENGDQSLSQVKASPIYQAILNSRAAGEDAILRNASATGGLRSGNVQQALAKYNQDLEQQALLQGISGLQGLAQLPTNANNIANLTAGIGETLGQGQIAAGQAIAAGRGAVTSGLIKAFSDARLKDNVKLIGKRNGFPWYSWTWNKDAELLGLHGEDEGVMAHEVSQIKPEAVRVIDGYLQVDYSALGV